MPSTPLPAGQTALAPARTGAVWRVRLLGGFTLDTGHQRVDRLRSRAAMALVARLAMAPGRDHGREELAALLWPEAAPGTGRARLRQTLSMLKSALEPPGTAPVLLGDRRVLRTAAGAVWCDAVDFEQALRRGHGDSARALYRGELLPGFYDEWIQDERLRLAMLRERLDDAPAVPPAGPSAPPAHQPGAAGWAPAAPVARLPHYLTRLIGAEVSGARLLALVTAQRLVSVLGPGGSGKTRLAVEVAHQALAGPQAVFDGASFVSLVDVATPTGLLDRLLQALRLGSSADAVDQVQQALAGRRQLLLLDNAEQLDDAAVATIATLAEATPGAHWLVTSRRELGLDGEQVFSLDALPLPAADADAGEAALATNPAVALYTDRARAQRPDFHPATGGPAERAALVALVQRLDGLPLALELAASHARTLGPAALLDLLDSARQGPGTGGLAYLARRGVRSGGDSRHASMLAVVESSWRLLDDAQRQLLCAISQVPAGVVRSAAAALAGGLPATRAQALLDGLVAQSVLRAQPGQDGQLRFAPYEPLREYALAQQAPGQALAMRQALLAWQLDWAAQLPATPPLATVRDELPNLTAALQQAGPDGCAGDAARLVLQLQSSWGEIALPAGALQALDSLLASPDIADDLAAGCHALAGFCHQEAGQPDDARRHAQQALARLQASATPDPAVQAMVLNRVARVVWRLDHDHARARALIAQALPLARQHQQPNTEAALLSLEAHLSTVVDRNPQRAAALSAQALALWTASGNRHLVNAGRYNLAVHRMRAGQQAAVLDEFQALADEGRALQDWDLAVGALEARGSALQGLKRWAESVADVREAVRLAWDSLEVRALAYALWNLTPALLRLGQATLAAETMGAAEALWRQRFGALDADDQRDLRRIRRGARLLLGPEAAASAWQRGAARPLGEVVRAVLAAG